MPDGTLGQTSHHCGTQWSNIIFAKQMHHIAAGDASLKIQGLRLDLLVKVWYNEIKKGGKGMPHG